MFLMKELGKEHGIPGQVAMEQIMACGLGPCYVCVRTFEVDGHKELRRVCASRPGVPIPGSASDGKKNLAFKINGGRIAN